MITFFRKIRQRILTKNNPTSRASDTAGVGKISKPTASAGRSTSPVGRYLLYAVGEIVLVVIGILIALQINTFNQNRINRKTELHYLNQMRNDLVADSLILFQKNRDFQKSLPIIKTFLAELHKGDNKESFNQAIRSYINNVLKPLYFVSSNATFNEMKASAKLGIIRDNVLRNGIVNLYNQLEELKNLYSTQYDFMSTIDVRLISGRGLAQYQQAQNSLFSPYNSEDELYRLKGIKAELESNAANWHWSIVGLQPVVAAEVWELREMIAEIDAYAKDNSQ